MGISIRKDRLSSKSPRYSPYCSCGWKAKDVLGTQDPTGMLGVWVSQALAMRRFEYHIYDAGQQGELF
jgi:hypothetical protein